ncbi:MAG: hypothetical protein ABS36_04075 [Acidobacteria bacterium SCN 69-37]|nr:MAG: hypothetical protein ABS36_04075 [Acidobacteria bacterium SCN 69-37]
MGRYLLYRMHPFSVGESLRVDIPVDVIRPPSPLADEEWQALWQHGGFPEPFLRRDIRFTRRWRALRQDQLTREDIREVVQVQGLAAMDVLAQILAERSS